MFTESLGQHHSHAGIQTTHLCLTYEILQHRRLIVLVRNVAKLYVFRFNFMDACPDLSRCVCCLWVLTTTALREVSDVLLCSQIKNKNTLKGTTDSDWSVLRNFTCSKTLHHTAEHVSTLCQNTGPRHGTSIKYCCMLHCTVVHDRH